MLIPSCSSTVTSASAETVSVGADVGVGVSVSSGLGVPVAIGVRPTFDGEGLGSLVHPLKDISRQNISIADINESLFCISITP